MNYKEWDCCCFLRVSLSFAINHICPPLKHHNHRPHCLSKPLILHRMITNAPKTFLHPKYIRKPWAYLPHSYPFFNLFLPITSLFSHSFSIHLQQTAGARAGAGAGAFLLFLILSMVFRVLFIFLL